jgi:hypothetical protein
VLPLIILEDSMAQLTINISPRGAAALLSAAILFGGSVASVSAFIGAQDTSNGLPVVLPYQGTLTEGGGQGGPVTGQRTMRFRVFDASTGGALLFESASRGVEVVQGKFSVVLGSNEWPGVAGQQLEAADLRGAAIWLELTMDDPQGGAPITFARQRVAPAPQAVTASQAAGDFVVPGDITAAAATVAGAASIGGSATVGGAFSTDGDVRLGDATTDTTTIKGDLVVEGALLRERPGSAPPITLGTYCGRTGPTTGLFEAVGVPDGYQSAKAMCVQTCGSDTAHMCSSHEMAMSAQVGQGPDARSWFASFSSDLLATTTQFSFMRDCQSWTRNTGVDFFGLTIVFTTNGNAGAVERSPCTSSYPIACCD